MVTALRRRDKYHAWARANFEAFTEPCLTCEAVLSESFLLLQASGQGKRALSSLLEREVILVEFSLPSQLRETLHLFLRYADTVMSLADACLVRMAELIENAVVFTTDSDFEIYGKQARQRIPLIPPE